MKKTIKVNEVLHKVGRNNNPFCVYKTDDGDFSCFKDDVNAALKDSTGKNITVEILTKGEYSNIISLVAAEVPTGEVPVVKVAPQPAKPVEQADPKPYKIALKQSASGRWYVGEARVASERLATITTEIDEIANIANAKAEALNKLRPLAEQEVEQ